MLCPKACQFPRRRGAEGGLYADELADGNTDVPTHRKATPPSDVDGYIYDDLSNDPEDPEPTGPTSNGNGGMETRNPGQYVETRYFFPTFTSDEIAGATSVRVINEATSYDDEELTGTGDVGDDYQADPDVWAGIVDMKLSGDYFGQSPESDDDGTVDAGICADSDGLVIDVLDNDGDENGNDYDKSNIEITGITQNPSQGTASWFDDNGVDKISYTPNPDASGSDSFEYEAEFSDGTTDTATTTINLTNGECGSLTVKVESPDGNPVSGATVAPQVDGTQLPQDTSQGGTASYNVEISDDPILTQMNESMIESVPDGFTASVERYEKDIEKTVTASGPKEEPDDFWYPIQERVRTKSKLATDPDSSGGQCRWDDVSGDFSGTLGTDPSTTPADTEETAILDLQTVVADDRNLEEVEIGYRISAQSCPNTGCKAAATTTANIDGETKTDHTESIEEGGGPTMVTNTFRYDDDSFLQSTSTLEIVSEAMQQENGDDAFVKYNNGGISIYTCPQ
jgi:hypothetical protein